MNQINLYDIELEQPITTSYVTAVDASGNALPYKIFVVDDQVKFLSNPVNRLEIEGGIINVSGITAPILGIEWVNADPTGYMVVQHSTTTITPSSTMYYRTRNVDNLVELQPFSGNMLGKGYVGLDENAAYEIVQPHPDWYYSKRYPVDQWFTPSGYVATEPGELEQFYDSFYTDSGSKVYFWRALNNPYGSGVFTQSDVKIQHSPIAGSVKVYDIMNLTSSGTPTEIPSSGWNIYSYASGLSDGHWEYQGYYNTVPEYVAPPEFIEDNLHPVSGQYVPVNANLVKATSWRLLPSSGYVDDENHPNSGTFDWVDGVGPTNTIIRFTNPISKYQVEYEYTLHSNIRGLSWEPKDSNTSVSKQPGVLYFVEGDTKIKEVPVEVSKSDGLALRTDWRNVRPTVPVNITLKFNSARTENWIIPSGSNKTLQFIRHNMGFSDSLGSI